MPNSFTHARHHATPRRPRPVANPRPHRSQPDKATWKTPPPVVKSQKHLSRRLSGRRQRGIRPRGVTAYRRGAIIAMRSRCRSGSRRWARRSTSSMVTRERVDRVSGWRCIPHRWMCLGRCRAPRSAVVAPCHLSGPASPGPEGVRGDRLPGLLRQLGRDRPGAAVVGQAAPTAPPRKAQRPLRTGQTLSVGRVPAHSREPGRARPLGRRSGRISGWCNQHRLHSAIGMVPPIEYEQAHTPDPQNKLSTIRGEPHKVLGWRLCIVLSARVW